VYQGDAGPPPQLGVLFQDWPLAAMDADGGTIILTQIGIGITSTNNSVEMEISETLDITDGCLCIDW
jgi:hypothetical protein